MLGTGHLTVGPPAAPLHESGTSPIRVHFDWPD